MPRQVQEDDAEREEAMNDISAPCYFCGRPAQPQVHHGRPENTSQGKGMGGDPAGILEHEGHDLCDDHHKGVHAKRCAFRVTKGGMVEILAPGDDTWVVGRRGLVLTDGWSQDKLCWTDLALAEGWAAADSKAVEALKKQCEIAWALKERYAHTTHKWYERAAEILSGYSGKHLHWRRVYERCEWQALLGPSEEHPNGRWQDMEKLGMTIMRVLLKVPMKERPAVLEKALDMSAEFKATAEISASIKGEAVAESAREMCTCVCGDTHTKKGE